MDHSHGFDILIAILTLGAVGFAGYNVGKDHEKQRCADVLLGFGLLAVEGQVEELRYAQSPYAELPVGWSPDGAAQGCGCR